VNEIILTVPGSTPKIKFLPSSVPLSPGDFLKFVQLRKAQSIKTFTIILQETLNGGIGPPTKEPLRYRLTEPTGDPQSPGVFLGSISGRQGVENSPGIVEVFLGLGAPDQPWLGNRKNGQEEKNREKANASELSESQQTMPPGGSTTIPV
jgi:hypothetical protein